jgi:hypothetical protein
MNDDPTWADPKSCACCRAKRRIALSFMPTQAVPTEDAAPNSEPLSPLSLDEGAPCTHWAFYLSAAPPHCLYLETLLSYERLVL